MARLHKIRHKTHKAQEVEATKNRKWKLQRTGSGSYKEQEVEATKNKKWKLQRTRSGSYKEQEVETTKNKKWKLQSTHEVWQYLRRRQQQYIPTACEER